MTNFHKAARCLLLAVSLVYPCVTETEAQEYVSDQLVCKVSQFHYIDSVNTIYGTSVIGFDPATYVYLLQINDGSDPDSLAPDIKATYGFVQVCEPNYLLEVPEGVQSSSPFLD